MNLYSITLIEGTEQKNYEWLYWIIDLAIFFLLLVFIGNWILAFIVSTIIGFILKSLNPFSKNSTQNLSYSLEFEKDQLSFKSEEIGKSNFIIPFDSIIDVESENEKDNSKILIKRHDDSDIVFTTYYSQETSTELLEKLKNSIISIEKNNKKCSNCGLINSDDARFCFDCGTPLK